MFFPITSSHLLGRPPPPVARVRVASPRRERVFPLRIILHACGCAQDRVKQQTRYVSVRGVLQSKQKTCCALAFAQPTSSKPRMRAHATR